MNNRVEKLAELCTIEYRDGGGSYIEQVDIDKFAELIVQAAINEMISQMWHHGIDESNNPAFYKAVDKVKEHFGVDK